LRPAMFVSMVDTRAVAETRPVSRLAIDWSHTVTKYENIQTSFTAH